MCLVVAGVNIICMSDVVSFRIDDLRGRLDRLVSSTGRPGAFYIREALGRYLDELEYVHCLETEAEAVRRGELMTVSLEELEAELGLED